MGRVGADGVAGGEREGRLLGLRGMGETVYATSGKFVRHSRADPVALEGDGDISLTERLAAPVLAPHLRRVLARPLVYPEYTSRVLPRLLGESIAGAGRSSVSMPPPNVS